MFVCMPAAESGGWMLRLRLWGSDARERTGADCHEDTLRGLVWHNWGSPEKVWPAREARDHCHGDPLNLCAHRQQDTLWMPEDRGETEVWVPVGRHVGWPPTRLAWVPEAGLAVTAVYNSRGGNASWLAMAKTCPSARGGWLDIAVVLTPEVAAATKLWAGTGLCPQIPGSGCSLALLRNEWPRANSAGGAHGQP